MMHNGIYYKIIGSGKPIIFIHGNNENHEIFGKYISFLNQYKLIFIDSTNHGLSLNKAVSLETIADDLFVLLKYLEVVDPIIIGFSDGANVGLIMNSQYCFSKSVLIGGNISFNGFRIWSRVSIYLSKLFCFDNRKKKNIELMIKYPNIDLMTVLGEVLLIYGKNDCFRKSHIKKIKEQIKNSTLKIIKGKHHIINSDECISTIKKFIE